MPEPYASKPYKGSATRADYLAGRENGHQGRRFPAKIKRDFHLSKMQRLKGVKVEVNGNGHRMKVGFNQRGNKHLYFDMLKRSNALQPSDLPRMDAILSGAKFIKKRGVSGERTKDRIERFYYYKAIIHGSRIYIHVAEESRWKKSGGYRHNRYVYAVTSRLK